MINVADPANVVSIWKDSRLGYRQVAYGYSTDGGRTWTNPGLFVDPHRPMDTDPALTVSRAGNFYAMPLVYTGDVFQPKGLLMYRSTNGGADWEERGFAIDGVQGAFTRRIEGRHGQPHARRINDVPAGNGCDQFHPWVCVDNRGIVTTVWLDRRQEPQNRQWHY